MGWSEDVKLRFSEKKDAAKWDQFYEGEATSLEGDNYRLRRDFTIDYIAAKLPGEVRICDLGCGAAPVTYELLKRGYDVVGIDYSLAMLRNAKRRLIMGGIKNAPLVNSNGESLPFQNEVFDCIVCLGVISYIENYANVIGEMNRLLKPGGALIISFRNKYNLLANDPFALVNHLVKTCLVTLKLRHPDEFRIGHFMYAAEVRQVVEAHGFSFEEFTGIGFGPYSIAGRTLFSTRTAIKLSHNLTQLANKLATDIPFRIASDVNIMVFTKKN